MSRTLLLAAIMALINMHNPALACGPAPSCWMQSNPAYLRSICQGYEKDHRTLKQIAQFVEEPDKVAAFGKACEQLNVHLKPE